MLAYPAIGGGDLPLYRKIAGEIYWKIFQDPTLGYIYIALIDRDAFINYFTEQLIDFYGEDVNRAERMLLEVGEDYVHTDLLDKLLGGFRFVEQAPAPDSIYSRAMAIIRKYILNHKGESFVIVLKSHGRSDNIKGISLHHCS